MVRSSGLKELSSFEGNIVRVKEKDEEEARRGRAGRANDGKRPQSDPEKCGMRLCGTQPRAFADDLQLERLRVPLSLVSPSLVDPDCSYVSSVFLRLSQ